jgi:GGDEF domain-containing protein
MSLQGPILVAADRPVPRLLDNLAAAGAFPIIDIGTTEIATAVASIEPAAVIIAEPSAAALALAEPLECLLKGRGPYTPVVARAAGPPRGRFGTTLPVAADASEAQLIARLRGALRVRTLHASVLRRIASLEPHAMAPAVTERDPLDDASVLVAGRGRSYPALVVAIGERTGLIGALSLESAFELLRTRDVDGLVIGEGFNRSTVERFINELGSLRRFRDLPIGVVEAVVGSDQAERLPNLSHGLGEPAAVVEQLMPLVRLHAFATGLRRVMDSLDAKGAIDPETGLRPRDVFARDLERAVGDAETRGMAFSLARFALEGPPDRRARLDAARLVARLIRNADFGCRDLDGAILVVFADTDLRTAHVVARRIASVLKHTTLRVGHDRRRLDPAVTLVAFRSRDTAATLLDRASGRASTATR